MDSYTPPEYAQVIARLWWLTIILFTLQRMLKLARRPLEIDLFYDTACVTLAATFTFIFSSSYLASITDGLLLFFSSHIPVFYIWFAYLKQYVYRRDIKINLAVELFRFRITLQCCRSETRFVTLQVCRISP